MNPWCWCCHADVIDCNCGIEECPECHRCENCCLCDGAVVHCEHCGSSREHVEMMAEVAGISDPICCEVTL